MRKSAYLSVASVLLLAVVYGLREIGKSRTFQFVGTIVPRVETSEKIIALTFDDGPTPEFTDEILSVLSEEKVKATFFLIKRQTITWDVEPENLPRIAESSDKITKYVLANSQNGSIILLHVMYDRQKKSLGAVKPIIQGLKQKGFCFVTVTELIESKR